MVWYLKMYLLAVAGTEAGTIPDVLKVCVLVGIEAGTIPEVLMVCLLVGTETGAVPEGVSACRYRSWCGT